MKKITRIIAVASFVALAASCAKEITPELAENNSSKLTKCVLSVGIDPDMKLSLEGGKSCWIAGDEIAVYQYGRYKASATKGGEFQRDKTQNIFTARTSGENTFDGSIAGYLPIDTSGDGSAYNNEKAQANVFYMWYPKAAIKSYSISNSVTGLIVPLEQTGQLADLGKYAIFNSGINEDGNIEYDSEKDILKITASTTMKCITPIVKFTVPESLNASRIEVSGMKGSDPSALAGDFSVRGSGGTSSFVAPTETSIIINNGGANISGDVYVVLAPTKIGSGRVDTNEATSLVFTITNDMGGKASITGSIKTGNPFKSNVINNIGTLPSTLPFEYEIKTDLKLLENEIPTVTLCDTLAGSRFYYTFGPEGCVEPTTASTRFYAKDGFALNVQASDYSTGVFKVLVHHDTHGEKTISGLVRNWGFNSASSLGLAFNEQPLDAASSRTVSDMTVTNKYTDAKNFEKFTASYIRASSNLYMSVSVKNTSRVSVLLYAASNDATKKRAYKFFDASAQEAIKGATPIISEGVSATSKTPLPYEIGDFEAGKPLTFWANGGTNIYNLVVLETAETITNVPEAPESISIPINFSTIGLPTSSSAALVGEYNFTFSGYPFSLYTYNEKMSEEPYTKYYYDKSNSRLLITKSEDGTQTDPAIYITIPAISGYKLAKVTFATTSKNKRAWVLDARNQDANKLGEEYVPNEGITDPIDVTVNDPGNLPCYYFRFNNTSSVYISEFSVTYEKLHN